MLSERVRRRVTGTVRVVLAALLLGTSAAPSADAAPQTSFAASVAVSNAALLDLLEVRPEVNSPAYERSFFRHWVDVDGDCQDTRVEVLAREDRSGARHGCRVVSGSWSSWLDNRTFTSSHLLDVDHLVALKEAWGSGAHGWQSSRREAFANDLGFEWSLRAVSASSNRSKSDRDPAEWLPIPSVRCEYVARWMAVKYRWGLSVDPQEHRAIERVLVGPCGARSTLLPPVVGASPGTTASTTVAPPPIAPSSDTVTTVPSGDTGPASPAETTIDRPVHPGAFCAPAGATGTSAKGVGYVCRSSDTDVRNRWRR